MGKTMRVVNAMLCVALLFGLAVTPVAAAEEGVTDIYRLGRSGTRFTPDPAVNLADFQAQFAKYRTDFEEVLRLGGWSGNMDGLFAAVATADEGSESAVRFRSVEPGERFPWMALRRKGKPAIIDNVRWSAKVPFPAWEIRYEEGDTRSVFVVPQWCLNLALDRMETVEKKMAPAPPPPPPPPPSPECRISAMVGEDGLITVDTSASKGTTELVGITLPDGMQGDTGELSSAGMGRWSFDPSDHLGRKYEDYSFGFRAVSRLSGEEDNCETTAVVTKMRPEASWIFRGFADGVIHDHNVETFASPADSSKLTVGCGFGFGVGLEYLFNERMGLDARIQVNQLDASLVVDTGTAWELDGQNFFYYPLTFAFNFHLTPDQPLDFYVGPMVGYVFYDQTTFTLFGEKRKFEWESDFGWGLQAGLDLPFGDSPWSLTSGVSYLRLSTEEENHESLELDLDPITVMIGIGYRF